MDDHQQALNTLFLALLEPLTLTYPDSEEEFFFDVDTSGKGLGAVLLQHQSDELRVIW